MFDFKRMSSGLVLGSVLGTCLVTQGVSAVDEVSNVSTQVNDDVDSSEGDKEIVKSPTGSGDVVDEDDDTEDKNDVTYDPSSGEASGSGVYTSEKSSVDDGGSLVKYLFAGVFGAIVGNASLIGMNSFLGGKK